MKEDVLKAICLGTVIFIVGVMSYMLGQIDQQRKDQEIIDREIMNFEQLKSIYENHMNENH